MKVICKQKTAQGLDLKEVTIIFTNNYDFGLEVGKEYRVMGMTTYKDSNCLYYLIDEDGLPNWFPYVIFTVSDSILPSNWHVKIWDKNSPGGIFTLFAFKELCDDYFYVRLVERDYDAMYTYFQRKIELENAEKEESL